MSQDKNVDCVNKRERELVWFCCFCFDFVLLLSMILHRQGLLHFRFRSMIRQSILIMSAILLVLFGFCDRIVDRDDDTRCASPVPFFPRCLYQIHFRPESRTILVVVLSFEGDGEDGHDHRHFTGHGTTTTNVG